MSVAEPRDLIEVLSRLEYWRQETPEENHRTFRRFTIRGDATLESVDMLTSETPPTHIMMRDISRGGAGFLCNRYLERGGIWRINFQAHNMRIGCQTICVRFCRLVQDGLFLIGGQFVVEPYILHSLGVDMHQMTDDVLIRSTDEGVSDFVPPDFLEEGA